MPLNRPTILCTGPIEEAESFLKEHVSADISIIPFTSISFDESAGMIESIRAVAGQAATVVFTSSNGIRSVGRFIEAASVEWQIYCIGNNTLRLARETFGEEKIVGSSPSAASLAAEIIRDQRSTEIVFFCGNIRRSELPDALSKQGMNVKEIFVYTNSLTPQRVEKHFDAIVFFSPSAVESFFSINTVDERVKLFAMGSTTAEAVTKSAGRSPVISGIPDKQQLLELAIHELQQSVGDRGQ